VIGGIPWNSNQSGRIRGARGENLKMAEEEEKKRSKKKATSQASSFQLLDGGTD